MAKYWTRSRAVVVGSVIGIVFVLFGTRYLTRDLSSSVAASAPTARAEQSAPKNLRWPLPPQEQAYKSIDGDRLMTHVEDIVALTRQNREPGSQQWGRLTGSPTDTKMRQWVMARFKDIGVANVSEDPFDLVEAQYFPRSWEIVAGTGSTRVTLTSAYPFRGSISTPKDGLELEPVWLGLGTPADFAGRSVRGKVAIVYSQPLQSAHDHSALEFGALDRARDAGAAAIVMVLGIPGNFQHVRYLRSPEKIPYFMVGMKDGMALRELIEQDQAAKVRISLTADMVPGLKSGTVWGVLPGTTDEEILITAHRDGFFEAAGDNASGVAVMLGLAEYFAKVPQAERRRGLRFMASVGHHHIGPNDVAKLNENAQIKSKLVLALNPEHTGWTETYTYGLDNRKATGVTPLRWYLRGSDRLRAIMFDAYNTFGVKTLQEPGPGGAGDTGRLSGIALVSLIQSPIFFHSNYDTPDVVSAGNMEAVRAHSPRSSTK